MTQKKNPAEEAVKQVESAVVAGKETVEKVMKAGQDAAQKGYEQAVAATKENVEKASTAFFTGYDELAEVGQGNYGAYAEAMTIWQRGVEAINKEMFSFAQTAFEQNVAASKDLLACKTINEVVELQNTNLRAGFDGMVAEVTKITEMSIKTANEATVPLQARVGEAVEKMGKPLAA